MRAVTLWLASVALAACSGAARPDIDPDPFGRACADDDPCPAPYACLEHCEDCSTPGPHTQCYLPCSADEGCPDGFWCFGDADSDHAPTFEVPYHACAPE